MPNTNGDPGVGCMNCSYEIATLAVVQDTLNGGTRYHARFDRDGTFPIDDVVAAWRTTVPHYVPGISGARSTANFSVVFTRGISAVDTIT